MQRFFANLITRLEDQIHYIANTYEQKIKQSQEICKILRVAYARLESFELNYQFRSPEEEITYFKHLKPKVTSKLIYHSTVYWIEVEKPDIDLKVKKEYLMKELERIRCYFEDNIGFICYYEANESSRDDRYFRRGTLDEERTGMYRELEKSVVGSGSYKIAKILANDQLHAYLRNELRSLTEPPKAEAIRPALSQKLTWTESKASLVELIYSIQLTGALNHGKVDIKDIALFFQRAFNIDLGDYYRAYLALRLRKTGRTKFLDALRNSLLARMDEQEHNLL